MTGRYIIKRNMTFKTCTMHIFGKELKTTLITHYFLYLKCIHAFKKSLRMILILIKVFYSYLMGLRVKTFDLLQVLFTR